MTVRSSQFQLDKGESFMRRILLAAFAALLLHAAPSMAAECTNLALARKGGLASASSTYNSTYGTYLLNNGWRETLASPYWNDGTQNAYPDWAQIAWSAPREIDRIIVRGPAAYGWAEADRTLGQVRVQYYDDATSTWVDVVGRSGQDNPIVDWVMPIGADGREAKQFDFAPVTTSKIRALIERGAPNGWSWLDEIEAYREGIGCEPEPQQCTVPLDGVASASSVHSSGLYPVSGVDNGRRESGDSMGYWNDNTNGVWPDWVQLTFDAPTPISRVLARIPLAREEFPTGEITLRRTRIQYYDDAASTWVDVTGRSGQDNPIIDWQGPREVYDGSESRAFDLARPVTTTKIRALIEDGSTDGWSWMDELEAYAADCGAEAPPTPRDVDLARTVNGVTAEASSERPEYSAFTLINGARDGYGYHWLSWERFDPAPAWAQVTWPWPRSINRIVLRSPIWPTGYADPYYTEMRSVTVQYWDAATSAWVAVSSTQANPLLDWHIPTGRADGTELKQFDFATISTTRVRALIEKTGEGYAFLDDIEAYWVS
jgi:hypothetical protein